MKRVLSLVLALVMVFGTIMPAFAEDAMTDSQAGQDLQSYGVIAGTDNGLDESIALTRAMMAKILADLYGKAAEAAIHPFAPSFTDVEEGMWYTPYIAFAELQGWMVGDAAGGTFRPNDTMKAQEVNASLVKALGYTVDYADATAKAVELEIAVVAVTETEVLRGEAFASLRLALDVPKMGMTDTLGTELALVNYVAPVVAPTTLEVVSVTALNTKQIEVVFNKELDATKAATAANYTVAGVAFGNATLQADKMTVVATMDLETATTNATEVEFKVLKAVGLAADYAEKITVVDTVSPTFVSVKAVGSKTLELTYSEPVRDAAGPAIDTTQFTVKSGIYTYVVSTATADYTANTITLTLGTNLLEGDVTIKHNVLGMSDAGAIRDFAGLVVVPGTVTMTFATDTTVATAELTSVNKETKVAKVTFSKPVHGDNVKLYHSVNGVLAYATANVSKTEALAATSWTFTFTNALPSGDLTFFLVNDTVATNQIQDLFGVKVANQTFAYSVVADTTAPTVSKVTVNTNASIDIDFSEAVPTAEVKVANFEILKPDGTALAFTTSAVDSDTVRLTASLVDNTIYSVSVLAMNDAAGNAMASVYTAAATVADNANPTLDSAYITDASTLYLVFSEAMDATDMAIKANYVIDGAALTADDTVTIVSPTKVKIVIDVAGLAASDVVTVGAVKDIAGKKLTTDATFSTTFGGGMTSDALTYTVELIAKDKLKLKFNKELSVFTAADFAPSVSSWLAIESNTVVSSKSEVVLVLAAAQAADAAVTVTATAGTTKSSEGTVVSAGGVVSSDKVAPTFTAEWINATTIHAVFDEDIEADFFGVTGTHGFTVNGGKLDSALLVTPGTDGTIVVLTSLAAVTADEFTKSTDVTYTPGFIVDLAANAAEAVAITDDITSAAGKAVIALETAAALDLSNDTNNAAAVAADTAADTAVALLPAGATKTALTGRITTAMAFITASDTAEALVVTSEAASVAAVADDSGAKVATARTAFAAVAYTGANTATTTALTARQLVAKTNLVTELVLNDTFLVAEGASATQIKLVVGNDTVDITDLSPAGYTVVSTVVDTAAAKLETAASGTLGVAVASVTAGDDTVTITVTDTVLGVYTTATIVVTHATAIDADVTFGTAATVTTAE